jgi:beta-lactam-binding protein with PASTA domain
MWRGLLKALAGLLYLVGVGAILVVCAYFAFNFFVRRGVTPVPELVGLPMREAHAVLADSGLRMRHTGERDRFHGDIEPGSVLLQRPAAGSLVKRGAAVDIALSKGKPVVEVPDLLGQAYQAAQVMLAGSGLQLGRTSSVFHTRGLPPGSVVDQYPPPGASVDGGGNVHLFLALEDRSDVYVMPDLVGKDNDQVRRFFVQRGFEVGSVKFEPYEGAEPGVVLRQHPVSGHPLRRTDVISLVVSASEEGLDEGGSA